MKREKEQKKTRKDFCFLPKLTNQIPRQTEKEESSGPIHGPSKRYTGTTTPRAVRLVRRTESDTRDIAVESTSSQRCRYRCSALLCSFGVGRRGRGGRRSRYVLGPEKRSAKQGRNIEIEAVRSVGNRVSHGDFISPPASASAIGCSSDSGI